MAIQWKTDYVQAAETARKTGKFLFLDFFAPQ